jgi:hypothetical protein
MAARSRLLGVVMEGEETLALFVDRCSDLFRLPAPGIVNLLDERGSLRRGGCSCER